MNKQEFKKVADAIRTYYPKENPFPNTAALQLWYEEFKEIPYESAVAGLRRHVNISRWCPTIAELKEAIVTNVAGSKDWGEAWNECIRVINRYGHNQEEEALEHMSPMTRQIVKRLGYRDLCLSENQMQDRANFRQIYEQVTGNEYEKAALPQGLQDKIAQIGNSLLLEQEGIDDRPNQQSRCDRGGNSTEAQGRTVGL